MLLRSLCRRKGRLLDEDASLGLHWVAMVHYRRCGFDCFSDLELRRSSYLDKQEYPMDNISMTLFGEYLKPWDG